MKKTIYQMRHKLKLDKLEEAHLERARKLIEKNYLADMANKAAYRIKRFNA